jgi:hypothetical protein
MADAARAGRAAWLPVRWREVVLVPVALRWRATVGPSDGLDADGCPRGCRSPVRAVARGLSVPTVVYCSCFSQKGGSDQMIKQAASIALIGLGLTFSAAAQTPTTKRTELTRGDLTGTNMEIIVKRGRISARR